MIEGLEYTCEKYPHIEEQLNKLKFDIQKANYLHSLLVDSRKESTKARKSAEVSAERRSHRQGFDLRAITEMFSYLEKLNIRARLVDHTFTLR